MVCGSRCSQVLKNVSLFKTVSMKFQNEVKDFLWLVVSDNIG